jgi:hypothetical protein
MAGGDGQDQVCHQAGPFLVGQMTQAGEVDGLGGRD